MFNVGIKRLQKRGISELQSLASVFHKMTHPIRGQWIQGHCFWPLPSFAHRKITWFPWIGSKTTGCRISTKWVHGWWLGVWMEKCYQKSGLAFRWLLSQKIQPAKAHGKERCITCRNMENTRSSQNRVSLNHKVGYALIYGNRYFQASVVAQRVSNLPAM